MSARWNIEKVKNARARPRNPNPKDEEQQETLPEILTKGLEIADHGHDIETVGSKPEEVTGRNFRITEPLLEKYGRTEGCPGCEARILGKYQITSGSMRKHTEACRTRIEHQMVGTEDSVRIRRKINTERKDEAVTQEEDEAEEEKQAMDEEIENTEEF